MLAKTQRLSRTQFSEFFKSGKRIHKDCVTIVFTPYPTLHGSVVVSKKVVKSAVVRNTLRRRVYGQMRASGVSSGVYIVVLKPAFAQLTKKQRATILASLFNSITPNVS